MLDDSLFTDTIHQETVTLADGSKHIMHFRELGVAEFRKYVKAEQSADEDVSFSAQAMLISMSLCDEAGASVLSIDRAKKLKPAVHRELLTIVMRINGGDQPSSKKGGKSGNV